MLLFRRPKKICVILITANVELMLLQGSPTPGEEAAATGGNDQGAEATAAGRAEFPTADFKLSVRFLRIFSRFPTLSPIQRGYVGSSLCALVLRILEGPALLLRVDVTRSSSYSGSLAKSRNSFINA